MRDSYHNLARKLNRRSTNWALLESCRHLHKNLKNSLKSNHRPDRLNRIQVARRGTNNFYISRLDIRLLEFNSSGPIKIILRPGSTRTVALVLWEILARLTWIGLWMLLLMSRSNVWGHQSNEFRSYLACSAILSDPASHKTC